MEANLLEQRVDSAEMNVIRERSDEAKREARRQAKKMKTAGTARSNAQPK